MVDRRTFSKWLTAGAVTAALPTLSGAAASAARTGENKQGVPSGDRARTITSFDQVKQVNAGVLNVGYAESGPATGPPVVLLHGWPYDIHSYVDVAPLLAAKGYRVVVPYLRGHGTTRFLSGSTFRNAEQYVFALDIIALMDALRIDKAIFAGFDWGTRTLNIIAVLWPQRCKALVAVSGYLITNREAQTKPLPPKAEWAWWYQYYFATDRGRLGLDQYRHDFTKLIWKNVSPTWNFTDATFDQTAAAFNNPDYVNIVIHNYRWRLGLANGDPRYNSVEAQLATGPAIAVPTVTLDGELDPFTPPGGDAVYRAKFSGKYAHGMLNGIGHNVPQEAPQAFAAAVVQADKL